MKTDWRKLGFFLISVGGVYIFFVGVLADFSQVFSGKHGPRLLALLFVAALAYAGVDAGRRLWSHYRALQKRLDDVRDFVLRSGRHSENILLCSKAHWLRQHGRTIYISELQSERDIVLDMEKIPLVPKDNLYQVWFSIISFDGGKSIGRGQVKLHTLDQACIELHELTGSPRVGDQAIPIDPPQVTELEKLLGNVLFIVGE
jgi:hypothetical protein